MGVICILAWGLDYMGFNTALAGAWINNYPINMQRTPVVFRMNNTNPTYNHILHLTVDDAALQQGRLDLVNTFYTADGEQIGFVSIPLLHFLQPGSVPYFSWPVQTPNGVMGFLDILVINHNQPQHQPHGYLNSPPSRPLFPPYLGQYPSTYQSVVFQQTRPSVFTPIIRHGAVEVISQVLCQGIFGNGSNIGDWGQLLGSVLDFGDWVPF